MPRNIKLIIEYDGTNYHGWQSQAGSGKATIQETLEAAIRRVSGETITLYSSGRTDAGVHAYGHIANFLTDKIIPDGAWAPALNHLLPKDIRIIQSGEVSEDFHARFSASGKTYKYLILNRPAPSALYRNRAWHIPQKLDLAAMKRAAKFLIGTHDFTSFRAASCSAKNPVRTLKSIIIKKNKDFLDISLTADAFLQYMVRNIIGTLIEVGLGRFRPESMKQLLASRDRKLAGKTAPSQGLFLVEVSYPER